MADLKISQLTAGAPLASTDQLPLARGAGNRRLTVAELFRDTYTHVNFEALRAASGLVPGRWYRVTGGTFPIMQVRASAVDAVAPVGLYEQTDGPLEVHFTGHPSAASLGRLSDGRGNVYLVGGENMLPFSRSKYRGNIFLGNPSSLTTSGVEEVVNCLIGGQVEIDLRSVTASGCNFGRQTKVNQVGGPHASSWDHVELDNQAEIVLDGGGATLTDVHLRGVKLILRNNPTVTGLTVLGTADRDGVLPELIIDGNDASGVLNNWGGVVHLGPTGGSSTVTLVIDEGLLRSNSDALPLPAGSPVGRVLVQGVGDATPTDFVGITGGHVLLPVRLTIDSTGPALTSLTLIGESAPVTADRIGVPNGGITLPAALVSPGDFLQLERVQGGAHWVPVLAFRQSV